MNSVRLWVVLLALVSALAGLASGLLLAQRLHPRAESSEPQEDYLRMCVETFELSQPRAELLAELLRNYHRELEDLRSRALAESHSEMEPDLRRLGLRYREMIRKYVLPDDRQRERFAELVAHAEEFSPAQ